MKLRTIACALAIVLTQGVEASEKKLHQYLPSPTGSPISTKRAKQFITLRLTDAMPETSVPAPNTPSPQNSHSGTRVGDPQQPAAPASPVAASTAGAAPPSTKWCCCRRGHQVLPAPQQ